MPRNDKHNFSRRQQAAEIAAATARRELDTHTILGDIAETCDWDAALAALTVPAEPTRPRHAGTHKPTHGGYPS